MKEGVPGLTKVAILWDETIGRDQLDATAGAARAVGLTLEPLGVRRAREPTGAFGPAIRERGTEGAPREEYAAALAASRRLRQVARDVEVEA